MTFLLKNLVFKITFTLSLINLIFTNKDFNKEKLPVIIWWSQLLYPHLNNFQEINCPLNKCISSKRQGPPDPNIKIAYIFYGTDFDGTNLPLPRKDNHIWALLHEESPFNNYIFSHSSGIRLFNYTSTFSRYSNHPLTTQHIPSVEYLTERKPLPLNIKNEHRRNGTAPILYLQSHCHSPSDRDRYIKDLMNYIHIDSFGACLKNKDLPPHLVSTDTHNSDDLFEFISKYKFHIAFENALCEDYITEKLIRALHVGSIPIYRGSTSVIDWVPSKKSVIIVDKFDNPKKLADYISVLDENDGLYEEYLDFKNVGITNEFLKKTLTERSWGVNDINKIDFIRSFECYICDKISELNYSSAPNMGNQRHMNCVQPEMSIKTEDLKLNDEWAQLNWIETYWFALDQAKAIEMMLKNQEQNSNTFYEYLAKTYDKIS